MRCRYEDGSDEPDRDCHPRAEAIVREREGERYPSAHGEEKPSNQHLGCEAKEGQSPSAANVISAVQKIAYHERSGGERKQANAAPIHGGTTTASRVDPI